MMPLIFLELWQKNVDNKKYCGIIMYGVSKYMKILEYNSKTREEI